MKKILFSLMAVLLVAGLVGGGVFAYFSDTESSTNNQFIASTLDLKINDGDSNVVMFNETVGQHSSGSGKVTLRNEGCLNGYLDVTFSNVIDEENGLVGWERWFDNEASGELADNLHILAYIDEDNDNSYTSGTDTLVYDGWAVNIEGERLSNYALNSGVTKAFRIEWYTNIDWWYLFFLPSDIAGFDIEFELAQTTEDGNYLDAETSNGNWFIASSSPSGSSSGLEISGAKFTEEFFKENDASELEIITLEYCGRSLLNSVSDWNGNGYKDIEDLAHADFAGQDDAATGSIEDLVIEVKLHDSGSDDSQAEGNVNNGSKPG